MASLAALDGPCGRPGRTAQNRAHTFGAYLCADPGLVPIEAFLGAQSDAPATGLLGCEHGVMSAFDVLLPLISTLLGAGITYAVNVRDRRRTYVEDLFNQAIAAVAAAESSVNYTAGAGRPLHLTDAEYSDLQKWMVSEGLKNWVGKCADANEAVARVVPYHPELASALPLHLDVDRLGRAVELIAELKRGRDTQQPGINRRHRR